MGQVARLRLLSVSVLACLAAMSGHADAATAHKKAAPHAEPVSSGPREVELAVQLPADQSAVLRDLVARFNAAGADKIVLSERAWDQGNMPGMMILGEDDDDRFLAGKPRYKPLYEVMKEAGEPLRTLRAPAFINPVSTDAKGQLLALPVGLSTPVLYYNRDAFSKLGLNPDSPPRTWADLQQTLGHFVQDGADCPYTVAEPARVMIENTSAWHNESVLDAGAKRAPLAFNGLLQIKHVAMMATWYRASYMRLFGHDDAAEGKFASGECMVMAAPSSSWVAMRKEAKFNIGVSPLPYHDDVQGAPQNTVADGPNLWIAAGKNKADYKVIARFVRFWLTPENQITWERGTGYLPLNREGVLATTSDLLSDDLTNVRVAVAELTNRPTTATSRAAREISDPRVRKVINEELDTVWSDTKPAKEALDDAVERLRSLN